MVSCKTLYSNIFQIKVDLCPFFLFSFSNAQAKNTLIQLYFGLESTDKILQFKCQRGWLGFPVMNVCSFGIVSLQSEVNDPLY